MAKNSTSYSSLVTLVITFFLSSFYYNFRDRKFGLTFLHVCLSIITLGLPLFNIIRTKMFFLKTCFRSSIKGNNITRCFKDNSKSCVNQDHLAIQWNDTLKSVTNLCNESEYCLKYCENFLNPILIYFIIVFKYIFSGLIYIFLFCSL